MHYPPETATIMLLARMIALVKQANDKTATLSMFSQFCHRLTNDVYEIAHNLLGEKFVGQIDILRQMTENALNNEITTNVCQLLITNLPRFVSPSTEKYSSIKDLSSCSGSPQRDLEVYWH